MRWHEITIHTTAEAEEMASNFLHELGAGGVTIEESSLLNKSRSTEFGELYELTWNHIPEGMVVIQGYFAQPADVERMISILQQRMAELQDYDIETGEVRFESRLVDEDDWANAWKQYFKPVKATDRLVIKPTWEPYAAEEGEIILELDPGMAFGTGTHPTTSLCLGALESILESGDDVIDVGTGSGILAIAAAKLGARHVLALDLDPVAVSITKDNIRLNGLEGQITPHLSDLLGVLRENTANSGLGALGIAIPVQVVVANILAEIILLLNNDVYEIVQPGGYYIVSGIYKNKEQIVETALQAAGFTIAETRRDQDWIAFIARKL